MGQTVLVANAPIATIIKSTVDSSFVLFTANFTTGVASSAVLPAAFTDYLTNQIQRALTADTSIDGAAFPGLLRTLVAVREVEAGSPVLADPAHIEITIPHSVESIFTASRQGAAGGTALNDIAEVTYAAPTATFTIGKVVLQSITVTPPDRVLLGTETQQYVATGNYSDGTTADLTADVNAENGWASDTPATATIAAGTGLATCVAAGTATISATLTTPWGPLTGSTGLTVTAVTVPGYWLVSAGPSHTVAISNDDVLWGWGLNSSGELGDGTTTERDTPIQIMTDVANAAAGTDFTIALKTDGTLWAWGANDAGQLGTGAAGADVTSPVQIGAGFGGINELSAGHLCSAVIKGDGTLWTWGTNSDGQCGQGSVAPILVPTQVGVGTYLFVACGNRHMLALDSTQNLWACGFNNKGQLGDTTILPRTSLVAVSITPSVEFMAVSAWASFAIKSDGTLWSWGSDDDGELGNGAATGNVLTPAQIDTGYKLGWGTLGGSEYGAVAIKADDSLWGWGGNYNGEVGDNTIIPRDAPVSVGAAYAQVSARLAHTAAVKSDETVKGWGANDGGQVGDGTTTERHVPTAVLLP